MKLQLSKLEHTPQNSELIFSLLKDSPAYCRGATGREALVGDGDAVFTTIPENLAPSKKVVFGIYEQEELVGIIDCLLGYPNPRTAFLGLLLLKDDARGKGTGSRAFKLFEEELREHQEIKRIRLSVLGTTLGAIGFWRRMGFHTTGEVRPYTNLLQSTTAHLLEKLLSPKVEISIVTPDSLDAYISHLHQHMSDSGIEDLIYTPFEIGYPHSRELMRSSTQTRLSEELSVPHWERVFVAEVSGGVIGHLNLRGSALATGLHRCRIGLGLDKSWRGQGVATGLMRRALDWVQYETKIEWVDLNVFAHNVPALELYRKIGFREIGRIEDAFRVGGISITDLQLSLKMERPTSRSSV